MAAPQLASRWGPDLGAWIWIWIWKGVELCLGFGSRKKTAGVGGCCRGEFRGPWDL